MEGQCPGCGITSNYLQTCLFFVSAGNAAWPELYAAVRVPGAAVEEFYNVNVARELCGAEDVEVEGRGVDNAAGQRPHLQTWGERPKPLARDRRREFRLRRCLRPTGKQRPCKEEG
jgi:hypothetical protein